MKKVIKLKTKRLILEPMTEEELTSEIERTTDEELKQAYREMLELAVANRESWEWNAPWKMTLRSTGEMIGDIGFKGAPKDYAVEIGYGIHKEYEGQGLTTEAAREMVAWAFTYPEVMFIEGETDPHNAASKRILEKLGMEPDGEGEEGPRFVVTRTAQSWVATYMCIGMSVGMAFGISMDKQTVGMCLGASIGMSIGAFLDSNEKKKIAAAVAERAARKSSSGVVQEES